MSIIALSDDAQIPVYSLQFFGGYKLRGFCVSADIEKITADSYRYLHDSEEFTPPADYSEE